MKRIKKIIICTVFIIFMLYYGALCIFTNKMASAENENRNLNKMPQLSLKTINTFSDDLKKYIDDYIPFRLELTRLSNNIKVDLFKSEPVYTVVFGDEGWLFYNSFIAEGGVTDELCDYSGNDLYSQEQMNVVLQEVKNANDYCKDKGADFIFVIAPNKSSIYPEHLVNKVNRVSENGRSEQLINYLSENCDVKCVYLKDALYEKKYLGDIYFRTDTHWNAIGGYIGAKEILSQFGEILPEVSEYEINNSKYVGDLYYQLGVDIDYDDNYPSIIYDEKYKLELLEYNQDIELRQYKSSCESGKKILLLGDSFTESMVQPFGIKYSKITFLKSRYYQYVDSDDYDVVVYELVERAVSSLVPKE